jgi:hypothetical protein
MAASLPSRSLETATRIPLPSPMRPVRRQSSQAFEDRRDGLPEALSLSAAPGFHQDDLGMVPAFNMLGRGNRLHGKGFGMMQNLVDPSAGWGYALQCSPTVRAGGKVFGGLPILPDKTAEYKAIDTRRLLTENGLPSVDLESRFYAVLKGCSSGLALNPRRSKSREPKRPKGRERAESIEMAFLRLVGIK